jgi:tight adherence protein B
MERIVLFAQIVATLFFVQAVYWMVRYIGDRRQAELRRRLKHAGEAVDKEENRLLRQERLAHSLAMHKFLASIGRFQKISELIVQTDLDWTVAQVLGYALALGGIGFLIGVIMGSLVPAIALSLLGAAVPYFVLTISRDRRSHQISQQLPEALDMLTRSLRSGHAMPTAIKLASQELPLPVATEFGRCYEEQSLGATLERSILNMTKRVPQNLDLKIFAVTVTVQGQVGGNIAEILERIAETIRERYKFYGRLRALTAEGRLSALILGSIPWVVMGTLWVVQKQYLQDFFAHEAGKMMAGFGFFLWLFGILWMRKITQVEV